MILDIHVGPLISTPVRCIPLISEAEDPCPSFKGHQPTRLPEILYTCSIIEDVVTPAVVDKVDVENKVDTVLVIVVVVVVVVDDVVVIIVVVVVIYCL